MSKMFQVYGLGQAIIPVLPPPLAFEDVPNSNQTNYEIGQVAYTPPKNPTAFYVYAGGGTWALFASGSGDVTSVLGTANQITVSTNAGVATISLPSAITAPGSLTTTTTLAAGTTVTAGTGVIATTGGVTVNAGDIINSHSDAGTDVTIEVTNSDNTNAASRAGVEIAVGGASGGDPYLSFQISGVGASTMTMGLDNSASDLFVISNSTAIGTSNALTLSQAGALTATTTVTATLGDITATNGNFVSSAAGKGLVFNANTATGAAASPVVLDSRAGQVVFTSVSIAAAADLTLTITNAEITGATTQVIYSMSGATTGAALSIKSVTNSAGSSAIVVTNGTGATTSTADITLNFIVVN